MDSWKADNRLKDRLLELVGNSYQQKEILEFARAEFSRYTWSLRTLQRRLLFFNIKCHDQSVTPEELLRIVELEAKGPAGLLGYRAMHRKIRNQHRLLVTRDDVYLAMNLICPDGLLERRLTNHRKRFKRRVYVSKGPNWTWSIDGHDKLSGRLKSEFPFGIHGGIDTFSRKVLWLVVWPSNCNPILPARLYFNAIIEHGYVPNRTRSDRGSENVMVAAMQNFLTNPVQNSSNHIFGSSVTNQVIEQWWKGFRERHGEYFKNMIHELIQTGCYDETNSSCRVIMAIVFIPLLQEELNTFKMNWNTHRIRKQNIYRPCGIPNFLYQFPNRNGGEQCGILPEIQKMEYLEKELTSLHTMCFVSTDLQLKVKEVLTAHGITNVNISNAKDVYIVLLNHFIDQPLEFDYS